MADEHSHQHRQTGYSPWRLLPILAILAGMIPFFAFGMDDYLTFATLAHRRDDLFAWRDAHYGLTALIFVAAYATMVTLSVPGSVWLTIAGGFLFGTVASTLLVVCSASLGSVAIFLTARYALGEYLRARAGPTIRRMEAGFRQDAFSYLLFLRLIPLFPFWLVNLVPAFLGVPLRTYVLATVIGIIPGSFVYSSIGNGLGSVFDVDQVPNLDIVFEPAILLPLIGLAALSLLPIAYKRYKQGKR